MLLGGLGDDLLVGGQGRDFLIGGRGADRIVGNADDDLLISGFTAYDNDRPAPGLAPRRLDRPRPDIPAADRRRSWIPRSGTESTSARDTVGDDGAADVLTGNSGLDWFWFDPDNDRVTDLHDEAFQNDLDFINQ